MSFRTQPLLLKTRHHRTILQVVQGYPVVTQISESARPPPQKLLMVNLFLVQENNATSPGQAASSIIIKDSQRYNCSPSLPLSLILRFSSFKDALGIIHLLVSQRLLSPSCRICPFFRRIQLRVVHPFKSLLDALSRFFFVCSDHPSDLFLFPHDQKMAMAPGCSP